MLLEDVSSQADALDAVTRLVCENNVSELKELKYKFVHCIFDLLKDDRSSFATPEKLRSTHTLSTLSIFYKQRFINNGFMD